MTTMMTRSRILLAAVASLALLAAGCESGQPSSQENEAAQRQTSYEQLVSGQPAKAMDYSPTRETINFWVDTWNEPGKLAYVYMIAANGQATGYYVLEGLPVSYCAMLTPNYELVDVPGDGVGPAVPVNAPGIDGAYYSGGQCNQYYGKDATTGAFLEWSIGSGQQYRLSSEPLPYDGAEPLGFTTVDDVN